MIFCLQKITVSRLKGSAYLAMKIEYFECFQMLAKYRNFSEAAENLYMSQSSLSKKIMELENRLGGQLFIRKKYEVVLSPFGEQMLNYINSIVEDYNILCTAAENYNLNRQKSFRVATFLNAAQSGLMDFITQFEAGEKNFYVETVEKSHGKLKQMLISHQVDVCYAYADLLGSFSDYKKILIRRDSLVLVANCEYAKLKGWKNAISLSDCKNERFCFPREDREMFLYFLSTCKENGFTPELTLSDVRLETVKKYVQLGMRCTLQMEHYANAVFSGDEFLILPIKGNPVMDLAMYVNTVGESVMKDAFVKESIAFFSGSSE